MTRKEKRHFNMIELLKVEEKKKQGGIGVSKTAKLLPAAAQPDTAAKVAHGHKIPGSNLSTLAATVQN